MTLELVKTVIEEESRNLLLLSQNIPSDVENVVNKILTMRGRLITSGIGKSGYIARKVAASFASTGTAAFYMHPSEASHGDLGMITANDVVMVFSNSGETREIFDILNYCIRFNIEIIAVTMQQGSTLALAAKYILKIPSINESSAIDAPTSSAILMLSLCDALMIATYEARGFTKEDFKTLHPGGKIGAALARASDVMRIGDALPIISKDAKMDSAIIIMTQKALGCAIVVENDNKICGIITDGDLRRHMHQGIVNASAYEVMTHNPKSITPETFVGEALNIMNNLLITSLVVQRDERIVGILHLHDIIRFGA